MKFIWLQIFCFICFPKWMQSCVCVCVCGTRIWTKGFTHARQALFCSTTWATPTTILALVIFEVGSHPLPWLVLWFSYFTLPALAGWQAHTSMPSFFCWDGILWTFLPTLFSNGDPSSLSSHLASLLDNRREPWHSAPLQTLTRWLFHLFV
jgi:hypothetical protein